MLLPWRRSWRQGPKQPLGLESDRTAVTLATLLMLWSLSVPASLEQLLVQEPAATHAATPARLPPLQTNAWVEQR